MSKKCDTTPDTTCHVDNFSATPACLSHRFAPWTRMSPNCPARHALADLLGRKPLVISIVELGKLIACSNPGGKSGQRCAFLGAIERTDKHCRELQMGNEIAQLSSLSAPFLC